MALRNRDVVGIAVDGGRRGENERSHRGADDGVEQPNRPYDVRLVVALRMTYGLLNLDASRKVKNRVDPTLAENRPHELHISDVALNEMRLTCNGIPMAGTEIVEDDHLVPFVDERPNHVRADVPGTPRNESLHRDEYRGFARPRASLKNVLAPLRSAVDPRLKRRYERAMTADEVLKARVKAHWEAAPCGTPDVVDIAERNRWAELERIRYEREPFIRQFASFESTRGRDVLEVGCGAGTDLLQFARAGANCSAVDLTEAGISLARRRLAAEGFGAQLQVADAEHLPFSEGSFDVVYSWGVIHHSPDTPACAKEIVRVLRPGGRFCVMIYNRRSLLALQAWLFFAAARGRPTRTISDVLAEHVESPGTKAYTRDEARQLFRDARDVRVDTVVTPYDLRVGRRTFLPYWTAELVPRQLGWFHVVSGTK